MGRHEHRSVEWRLIPPPALPVVVAPWATVWTELVASHDFCADVVGEVPSEVVVEATATAGVRAVRPTRGRACPRHHPGRIGVTERTIEALIFTGAESVFGNGEVLDFE